MLTRQLDTTMVDYSTFARSLRRIGCGWLVGMFLTFSLGSLSISAIVGALLTLGGLRLLKSASLGSDADQRVDEIIVLVAVASAGIVVGSVLGLSLVFLAPLVLMLAELRFSILMRKVLLDCGAVPLARRWRSTSRALLGIFGVSVGAILVGIATAWAGQPAVGFATRPTNTWVFGRPVEITGIGAVILIIVGLAWLWQIVVLNRVFQPTKAWVRLQASEATADPLPTASPVPAVEEARIDG